MSGTTPTMRKLTLEFFVFDAQRVTEGIPGKVLLRGGAH